MSTRTSPSAPSDVAPWWDRPRPSRVIAVAVALVFVAYALGCLYGIASPWQWGHNGFNGAAFAQAAKNSLRFGISGQAQYWTALTKPTADAIYTHHPQMLHWHLIALFKLVGASPLIGRLVPATYSFLTLVLVHRIGRVLWDRMHALVAVAIYALVPLHTIFANMIDHEQGAIFWSLLSVYQYVRWHERHDPRRLVLVLVATTIGVQFDWPPYYVAFFIACHALGVGLGAGRPIQRFRPEWTFTLVFSIVVLVNFVGFFLWIRYQRGTLHEMAASYAHRTGKGGIALGYVLTQYGRLIDLHGPIMCWLTLLWVPLVTVRVLQRKATRRDLVPAAFLAAQIIHSLVFRSAGWIHSYWTYWMGAATAFGGAEVVVASFGFLWTRAERLAGRHRSLPLVVHVIVVALVTAGAIWQIRYAYARLRWGFATGTAAYTTPYPDIGPEVRFARWLAREFPRESTHYLVHSSLIARIEFHWYTDAPAEARTSLEPGPVAADKRVILLADTSRLAARATLSRLIHRHPTWIFDRRFVAIDVSATDGRVEALRSEARPASRLWRWFVDPLHPAADWVGDDVAAAFDVFDYQATITAEMDTAGATGTRIEWDCPRGEYVAAFEGAASAPPVWLAHMRAKCRKLEGAADGSRSHWFGGASPNENETVACPPGYAAIGFMARTGKFVAGTAPICGQITRDAAGKLGTLGVPLEQGWIGGLDGPLARYFCPPNSVVRGVRMRSGALVDSVGVACGTL